MEGEDIQQSLHFSSTHLGHHGIERCELSEPRECGASLTNTKHRYYYFLIADMALGFQEYAEMMFIDTVIGPEDPFPIQYQEPFKRLWVDEGVQQIFARSDDFAFPDNWP